MKKKIIAIIIAVTLAFLMSAGCFEDKDEYPITLRVWNDTDKYLNFTMTIKGLNGDDVYEESYEVTPQTRLFYNDGDFKLIGRYHSDIKVTLESELYETVVKEFIVGDHTRSSGWSFSIEATYDSHRRCLNLYDE
jgi:hypothetical protein